MRKRCDALAGVLPALIEGAGSARWPASGRDARHVETCLRCQAELARYRRISRLLAQLREEREVLPPGLVRDVLSSVEQVALRRARRGARRGRLALAGVLVTAAAVAGALAAGLGRRAAART